MASGDDDSEDLTGTIEPRECMACRATGRVISNLGGTPSTVDCPWCGGTGMRSGEIDAQSRWPANEVPAAPEAGVEKAQDSQKDPAAEAETPSV